MPNTLSKMKSANTSVLFVIFLYIKKYFKNSPDPAKDKVFETYEENVNFKRVLKLKFVNGLQSIFNLMVIKITDIIEKLKIIKIDLKLTISKALKSKLYICNMK